MAMILITGVPGTGKGTVSAELGRKGFSVVAVNGLVDRLHLWTRKERGSKVVDLRALRRELLKVISLARRFGVDVVIEGHLLCELQLPADVCIVLRTDPDILRRRLLRRRYPLSKLEENIEAELIDYCTQLSEKNLKGICPVYEVSTSGTIKRSVRDAMSVIEGKGERFRAGWVDWSGRIQDEFKAHARRRIRRKRSV